MELNLSSISAWSSRYVDDFSNLSDLRYGIPIANLNQQQTDHNQEDTNIVLNLDTKPDNPSAIIEM